MIQTELSLLFVMSSDVTSGDTVARSRSLICPDWTESLVTAERQLKQIRKLGEVARLTRTVTQQHGEAATRGDALAAVEMTPLMSSRLLR